MFIMTQSADQTLREEQEKFKAVFYGSETAMVIFKGPEFIIEMHNSKYQDIYPGRDILGKSLIEAVPELMSTKFPEILKGVYETGQYYSSHEGMAPLYNAITGEVVDRYFDTTFSRINYGSESLYRILATPREVTERVVARKRLEQSLKELEQEKDLRERFVSALSHDLRTPLAVAKVSSQILKRKSTDSNAVLDLAGKIETSVIRADRMIRDLLDANRLKAGKGIPLSVQPCQMELIIVDIISDLKELYGDRFNFKNSAGEVYGYWDSLAILRILDNLASNAIKYGTPNSEITLALHRENDWIEICVHNYGNAIPPDELALLFNQFRRTTSAMSSNQVGWGIGLSLVKGLTEAHGGTLRVESEPEKGTTFFVRLPVDCRKNT